MKINSTTAYLEQDSENIDQDKALDAIEAWSLQHGHLFLTSKEAQRLTPYEKEKCLEILEAFARFCYIFYQEKPEQWTPVTAADICENIFPEYILEKNEFFKAALSILPTFLQWAENEKIMGKTTALQESICRIEKNMLENANDVEHWNGFKVFLMTAREAGVDLENEEEMDAFLEEYTKTLEEIAEGFYDEDDRPYPKQEDEINTIKDIIEDLEHITHGYPFAAVFEAITSQKEVTPALLDMLTYTIEHYETLEEDYIGYFHALYLLAQFREKKAFPLILDLASLPEEYVEKLLSDVTTESLHKILGAVYDGNLGSLKAFIEAPDLNVWSRSAGLATLLVLVKENVLERDFVIDYMKELFHHPSYVNDQEALQQLILVASDLYPIELYDDIKIALQTEKAEDSWMSIEDIDDVLEMGKDEALKENLYENPHYDATVDAVDEMMNWPCFASSEYEEEDDDSDDDEDDFEENNIPYKREVPKIGRNDSCSCGSGKKYKKCCG